MTSQGHWQVWALASAVFAASTAILAKIGVENVDSDFATLIRTCVILVVVLAILGLTGHWQPPSSISARSYAFLGLSGVATGLSWLCYFKALQLGNASAVAPIDKLSVVLVAVFAFLFLHERIAPAAWIGIVLIGAGAVIVAASG